MSETRAVRDLARATMDALRVYAGVPEGEPQGRVPRAEPGFVAAWHFDAPGVTYRFRLFYGLRGPLTYRTFRLEVAVRSKAEKGDAFLPLSWVANVDEADDVIADFLRGANASA